MPRLKHAIFLAAASLAAVGMAVAQTPALPPVTSAPNPPPAAAKPNPGIGGAIAPPRPAQAAPALVGGPDVIITDLAGLPAAVANTRARILAAARSGNISKLVAVMRAGRPMPIFSLDDDNDPAGLWRATFPDSAGVEILSTLIGILETGVVHVDRGTPQELYMWPYFVRMPLDRLTPEQKVELFRLVTGADYKTMLTSGVYNFYRLGIAPDGSWRFFVTGD